MRVVTSYQMCVYVFLSFKNRLTDHTILVAGSTSKKAFLVPMISVLVIGFLLILMFVLCIIIICKLPVVIIIVGSVITPSPTVLLFPVAWSM